MVEQRCFVNFDSETSGRRSQLLKALPFHTFPMSFRHLDSRMEKTTLEVEVFMDFLVLYSGVREPLELDSWNSPKEL